MATRQVVSGQKPATDLELLGQRWGPLRCIIGGTEDVLGARDQRVGIYFFCLERHRAQRCLEARSECTDGLGRRLCPWGEGDPLDGEWRPEVQ